MQSPVEPVEPLRCRIWLYGIKAARKRAALAGSPAAPLTATGQPHVDLHELSMEAGRRQHGTRVVPSSPEIV